MERRPTPVGKPTFAIGNQGPGATAASCRSDSRTSTRRVYFETAMAWAWEPCEEEFSSAVACCSGSAAVCLGERSDPGGQVSPTGSGPWGLIGAVRAVLAESSVASAHRRRSAVLGGRSLGHRSVAAQAVAPAERPSPVVAVVAVGAAGIPHRDGSPVTGHRSPTVPVSMCPPVRYGSEGRSPCRWFGSFAAVNEGRPTVDVGGGEVRPILFHQVRFVRSGDLLVLAGHRAYCRKRSRATTQ